MRSPGCMRLSQPPCRLRSADCGVCDSELPPPRERRRAVFTERRFLLPAPVSGSVCGSGAVYAVPFEDSRRLSGWDGILSRYAGLSGSRGRAFGLLRLSGRGRPVRVECFVHGHSISDRNRPGSRPAAARRPAAGAASPLVRIIFGCVFPLRSGILRAGAGVILWIMVGAFTGSCASVCRTSDESRIVSDSGSPFPLYGFRDTIRASGGPEYSGTAVP